MRPVSARNRTLLICGLAVIGWHAAAVADQPLKPGTAAERIRRREAALQSLKFSWKEDCFDGKGSRFDPETHPVGPEFPEPPPPLPAEGVRYEQSHTFSYDGKRTSHVASLVSIRQVNGKRVRHDTRTTFNGTDRLSLSQPSLQRDVLEGRIYPANTPDTTLNLAYVEPILLWYRLPLDDGKLAGLDRAGVRKSLVNDVPCVVAEGSINGRLTREFHLDPAREFIPLRMVLKHGDRIQRQTDFEYVPDEELGWALSGWKLEWFSADETLKSSMLATVQECELNPDLPESEFTIEFPAGTLVDDLRTKTQYNQRAKR